MIRQVRRLIRLANMSEYQYITEDDLLWDTLGEAIEHEERLTGKKKENPVTHAVYEDVTSIQQAINMAVAENRVVRFITDKSNKELRKGIDDIKGCKLMKPSRESKDVAVIPESIQNFDFNEVDTSIKLTSRLVE